MKIISADLLTLLWSEKERLLTTFVHIMPTFILNLGANITYRRKLIELLQTIRNSAGIKKLGFLETSIITDQTYDCEHGVGGGVSKVSVFRPEVQTGRDGVEVSHVGGDEDGGEDVAEDEDADDGQQSVHAVLQRPGGGGLLYRMILT